jgi:hypothetical protein
MEVAVPTTVLSVWRWSSRSQEESGRAQGVAGWRLQLNSAAKSSLARHTFSCYRVGPAFFIVWLTLTPHIQGGPLATGSLIQYGITPIDSAKTDVTMRFYVENQLEKWVPKNVWKHLIMSVTYVKFVKVVAFLCILERREALILALSALTRLFWAWGMWWGCISLT